MKSLNSLLLLLSIVTLPILLYAQQPSCHESFRECTFDPPGGNPISIPCGAQDTYEITGPQQMYMYACRAGDANCNGELPCNVITRSSVSVFLLTCPETGQTTYCVRKGTSPSNETLTSTTCTGEECDNGYPPRPGNLIPANNDANASQWKPWPRR